MKTLDEIKKAKLWTSAGDTRMTQWYKTNGFNPQEGEAKDVVPQMKIGTIDATPSPSYIAQVTNLYRDAPFMLDIHVGPLLGGLVVTTAAWNATSPEDQAKITAAAKVFEKSTSASVPAQDNASVGEMQKRGLTVTKMAPKDSADLYAQIAKLVASMRGDMVPADMYDAAKSALDAHRAKKPPVSR